MTAKKSPMNLLAEKIEKSKIEVLQKIAKLHIERKERPLALQNDETSTPWEKGVEKYYHLAEHFSFNDEYARLIEVALHNYGHSHSEEQKFSKKFGYGDHKLKLELDHVRNEEATLLLRGSIYGDVMRDESNHPIAVFDITGVLKKDLDFLRLEEELLLEAYLMENLAHYKTAFFTYFSYLETKISQELKKFEIPQELEYALEHLSLDQKTKIVARDVYGVDLGNSKIWSQFSDAFQQAKDLRNKIAHATKLINVEIADINNCFFCIVVINGMNNRLKEFDEIRQFYYPKKKDSLIPENFLVSY